MIVTIDGPAGAGKSSTARLLAERLGFDYLDTGAMFRAVTLAGQRAGIDLDDPLAQADLLEKIVIELPPGKVLLNGEDVTQHIRSPEITAGASPLAVSAVVRQRLKEWQQALAMGRNIVCEGRDQGTAVFPRAECKFFLVADPEERARRRQREMQARGVKVTFEEILQTQQARDRRDSSRDIAPMVPAADAQVIDSTHLSLQEVVELMRERVASV